MATRGDFLLATNGDFLMAMGRRHTLESIGQQLDDMGRFRGNTRSELLESGFEVLNGHRLADRARAMELGGLVLTNSSEWVCLRSDGSTPQRLKARKTPPSEVRGRS
jgi:hypothetical protein